MVQAKKVADPNTQAASDTTPNAPAAAIDPDAPPAGVQVKPAPKFTIDPDPVDPDPHEGVEVEPAPEPQLSDEQIVASIKPGTEPTLAQCNAQQRLNKRRAAAEMAADERPMTRGEFTNLLRGRRPLRAPMHLPKA